MKKLGVFILLTMVVGISHLRAEEGQNTYKFYFNKDQSVSPERQSEITNMTEPQLVEHVERLTFHLRELHDKARTERLWTGGLFVGLGALTIGAGMSFEDEDRDERTAFGIVGGVVGLVGAAVLAFPTDFEKYPNRYFEMASMDHSQRRSKVAAGEVYLGRLSNRAKTARVLNAAAYSALGIGTIAAGSSDPSAITSGSILIGAGIARFLIQMPAESEYENYMDWRKSSSKVSQANFGVQPLKKGAVLSMNWAF